MKTTIALMLIITLLLCGCGSAKQNNAETQPEESISVVYEAFFLDNDEIIALFADVRGEEAPYANVTKDFHVTTAFMPEQAMSELYGTEVTVQIYAYQDGEVKADDGSMTANEGFFCTITTENAQLQQFIDSTVKNWHITGSYKDAGGAKYTEYLDLTDAQPVSFTVKGSFGGYMTDNQVHFSAAG